MKQFINRQNPRLIYSILFLFLVLHFYVHYHNILKFSDVDEIRKGKIEFFILSILAFQIFLINNYIQRLLKFGVVYIYFSYIFHYFEILMNQTDFYKYSTNSSWTLLLMFLILSVISYVLFTVIENTKSKITIS